MSVTEGQIRGKYHQDTNVPRSNPLISSPLCHGQGQVHRDSEPQGGGRLHRSPVQVVRAGAVPPWLPHTIVLPPAPTVPAPEPAGSQHKQRRQQKKKSAAEKAAERADKECRRCHQLGHYEVDCPQPADEPMEIAHGDASVEVTRMEVSPGPHEQGRPVEEPASSSQETSLQPATAGAAAAAGAEEGQSREEQAQQAACARVATAHYSQWDNGGCEPRPDLVICHSQGVDHYFKFSWVRKGWATFSGEVGHRHEKPRLSLWEPQQGTTSGEELNSWSSRSHHVSSACSSVWLWPWNSTSNWWTRQGVTWGS